MEIIKTKFQDKRIILSLGADSSGGFSIFQNGLVYYQAGFGDLMNEENFLIFSNSITAYLGKNKLKPKVVLIDLHPLFRTVELGEYLAKKYQAKLIRVQHHIAHIFSVFGEHILNHKIETDFIGIACDGTGYGFDEKIWGGEVFQFTNLNNQPRFKRIAHLENHVLIGGERAIIEPARVLISILASFLSKKNIFKIVKKYYSQNEFELIYNQLKENFNCIETSSTGRVLDAVAVLLGFINNESRYKHEPIKILEANSTDPFEIKPKIVFDQDEQLMILETTPLFVYLLNNLQSDKKRLAATAQMYLAKGFLEIVKKENKKVFLAGGVANNKIISEYLLETNFVVNKHFSRGDEALSWGQMSAFLLKIL